MSRRLWVIPSIAAAVFAAAAASNASAPAVPADMQNVLSRPYYANATWSLRVLDGAKVLVDVNSRKQLFIGSVRKVFTLSQLLDAVGPNKTYDTPVYRTGAIGNGVLHGNLILVASGDLTMGGRINPDGSIAISNWDHNEADSLGNAILTAPNPLAGYAKLAQQVRAAGIRRVTGEVIVDDRLWTPWNFRDQFNVRPIFVNDDLVDVSITPGGSVGARAQMTTRPVSAALKVVNGLTVGAAGSKDTLKIDPQYPACIGKPGCSAAITGSLPSDFTPPLTGKPQLVQAVRIVQPSNYARTVFVEQLAAAGVKVDARTVEPNPTQLLPGKGMYLGTNQVARLTGMPERDDAKYVAKISYNIGADSSLVLWGLTKKADSMPAALAAERKNLAANFGITSSQYHFVDGSGGGDTTASGGAVVHMLQAMAKRPAYPALYDALPVLAVDGSLAFVKDFEKDPTLAGAAGHVRAKTGTFVDNNGSGGVVLKGQALAGYVTTKRGHHLTFQLVVNNVPISGIDDIVKVFQDEGTLSAMLWRDY
ncbi:MAG TPA: D-alanyl-D-alanine carboxypeptidase [Candidatus Baltobacteraceae bacterium]|nr:D-alanyl-D-alanine carboxypeptidase [Candidatus Baltobacteraceae bacterium]